MPRGLSPIYAMDLGSMSDWLPRFNNIFEQLKNVYWEILNYRTNMPSQFLGAYVQTDGRLTQAQKCEGGEACTQGCG